MRDSGDNRTNIYVIGLAHSSAGKDWPRKINSEIVHAVGLGSCLGDRFASGEGIQDALHAEPAMLFQTDEIDGLILAINKAADARHESIMSILMTLYSASNTVYPMRRKAGSEPGGVIIQPNLVLFGTAIPNHYYESLSERMLTNGFLARSLIVESGPRGRGQEPCIIPPPERVMETATHWARMVPRQPGYGVGITEPWVVNFTDSALQRIRQVRAEADKEYSRAEAEQDPVATTVWGRANEHVRKLALLYAISENHKDTDIDVDAVNWAWRVVHHQTRRALFMAATHAADNAFHAVCQRALAKLRESDGRKLDHSTLLKRMKLDAKTFENLIDTLVERGDIVCETVNTAGRSGVVYRLVG